MLALPSTFAANWPLRRYSYAAVLLLTGLRLAFPAHANLLVGIPLAVGMVVLGVAHGACDQLVVPAGQPAEARAGGWHYWLRFLASYLGLAAVAGALWWAWPAATVGGFFLLTIWHWGSADAPDVPHLTTFWWLAHSLLRGLLLFALPMWQWPTETISIVNGLLAFAGAPTVGTATFEIAANGLGMLVLGGHLLLWARYAGHRQWSLLQTELLEVLVLVVLFLTVPPRLSVGIYFVFWHSLQHVLRLNGWLGYTAPNGGSGPGTPPNLLAQIRFFLRRAAPLLLVSCAALLLLSWLLAAHLPNEAAWFSLALVVASVVTLPHALLVTFVMDARQWQKPRWAASPSHHTRRVS